jgi:hypothetical protein
VSAPDHRSDGQRPDPFALLGLPASAALTDDDVRSAWRRVAVATHPDRADGGDPDRFAASSAAYTVLRTRAGRGEVLADLAGPDGGGGEDGGDAPGTVSPRRGAPVARDFAPGLTPDAGARVAGDATAGAAAVALPTVWPAGPVARAALRVIHGRPAVLAIRFVIVAAVGAVSAALVGFAPATPALLTGALTWLVLTARHDLAPPE